MRGCRSIEGGHAERTATKRQGYQNQELVKAHVQIIAGSIPALATKLRRILMADCKAHNLEGVSSSLTAATKAAHTAE